MTLADHLSFLAEADSALGRLKTEPELPGQADSSGVVHPAVDPDAEDRRLALKLVRGPVAQDAEVVEAARADARAQTGLEHPRIATLYEAGHMPAGFFLLMEWRDGTSLDQVLRRGPMDPWAALRMAYDVADATEAATIHGILHRDLTPTKVIVGADGHAALGDLGAGRRRAGEPVPLGSLDYVSPEQIRDEPLTAASHEYALACILFQCLAGETPFHRARASAKTFWHVRAPRPLLSEHRDLGALDEVLVRGMAIAPGDRHGSPLALVDALGAALGHPPTEEEHAAEPRLSRMPRAKAPHPATTGASELGSWEPAPSAEGSFEWADDMSGPGRLAWTAGILVALAVLAAALAGGLLAGRETKDPPAISGPGAVGTSRLAFVRPADWRELDPGPDVPGLTTGERVAVGAPGATATSGSAIVAGLATAGRDGVLPDELLDALSAAPGRGEPVRLGDLQARRFRDLSVRGMTGTTTIYAIPTSEGTATIACVRTPAPTCDTQAATLQLTGPKPQPVEPAKAYGKAVAAAFKTLNQSRTAGLAALASAGTRSDQATAAGGLGTAYGAAAGKLRSAPDRRYVEPENAAIVKALDEAGAAYQSMAFNAGRGDEAGYADARSRAIAAERGVERAVRRLQDAGYRVR